MKVKRVSHVGFLVLNILYMRENGSPCGLFNYYLCEKGYEREWWPRGGGFISKRASHVGCFVWNILYGEREWSTLLAFILSYNPFRF